jgi:hypothetical protein
VSLYSGVDRWFRQSWFSYLTLALLQLKVMWRVWDYKDLPTGDTPTYYLEAYNWFELHQLNSILWSPLYTSFMGTLLHVTRNLYSIIILHRLLIVFAASILVLALMRRLLPKGLAWLIAAWWVVLPINFNTVYEVHLFSVLPVLVAALLVLQWPTTWGRGAAIAVLAGSTVLVRNELSLATAILVGLCFIWEVRSYRHHPRPLCHYGLAYGVPMVLTVLVIASYYQHSLLKVSDPEFAGSMRAKHTFNVCQIYATGYQQRHLDWMKDPWSQCQDLMMQTFGQPLPTLSEAFFANPGAMLEHFSWNIQMALSGIQLSLFNATSGSANPDYYPVNLNVAWILAPTLIVGGILTGGLILMLREREFWWHHWLKGRAWGWSVILSAAAIAAFVVLPMQRPRPSYLFSLAIVLMAAVGMGLFVILNRWPIFRRWQIFIPAFAIALLIAVPPYYQPSDRPLLTLYQRLLPFQTILNRQETVLLSRELNPDICYYLSGKETCQIASYVDVQFFQDVSESKPLVNSLQAKNVTLFYVDALLLKQLQANPHATRFLTNPNSFGWTLLADQAIGDRWMLFQQRTNHLA